MVVPILDPLPSVTNTANGIREEAGTITDRTITVQQDIKDNAHKAKKYVGIMKFIPIAGLASAIIGILSKPLEFIVMLIGGIILAVIFVIYKLLALPPLVWIAFVLWFIIMRVIMLIVYTIVIGVVVVFICFILLVITFINYVTKGKLNKLVLCQNSPLSWYQVANYHLGNKFERSLFCKSACAPGYQPDELTGEFCNRINKGSPSYCPQAEIMRIFSNFSRYDTKYIYDNFDPTTSFWFNFMTPEQKENEYKNYYLKRQQFFTKCNDSLGNYNNVSLSLCAALDMMKKNNYNGMSDRDIARLQAVCNQGFCNSKSRFFFCGKFGTNDNESKGYGEIIKLFVKLFILAVLFMFILYFTYQFVAAI